MIHCKPQKIHCKLQMIHEQTQKMNCQRQLLYQTTKDKFLHAQKTNTMALPIVMVFIFCNLQDSLVSPERNSSLLCRPFLFEFLHFYKALLKSSITSIVPTTFCLDNGRLIRNQARPPRKKISWNQDSARLSGEKAI